MSTLPITVAAGLEEIKAVPAPPPRVTNLHREELGDAFYVGRASPRRGLAGSAFGNPYVVGRDGTREQVIELYRRWLLGRPELLDRLLELRGRRLACWCRPEPCHAEVLAELVDADELLDELKAAGVTVEARGARLRLSPASRVSEALQARVAALKTATLSLLAARSGGRESAKEFHSRLVAEVAETLRVPVDCLPACRRPCGPLAHDPAPAGEDGRGWTRYACRKCGKFYGYSPHGPAALQSRLESP